MATLLFLDDAEQRNCKRPRTGPLVAVGGIAIADTSARDLDRRLDEICQGAGFPAGEFFKWSPGKSHWMRDNLIDQARRDFFEAILSAVADFGGVAQVTICDRSRGTAVHENHEHDVILLALERFYLELGKEEVGIVVVARPSGGRSDEDAFLSECVDLVAAGTDYLKFDRLAMNVATMPMQNSRILQAADLVVSITTAMTAGHTQFASALFPQVHQMLRGAGGRKGGVGLKIHPDFVYANLYHWILEDDYLRRGNSGWPLPKKGLPFFESPDVF